METHLVDGLEDQTTFTRVEKPEIKTERGCDNDGDKKYTITVIEEEKIQHVAGNDSTKNTETVSDEKLETNSVTDVKPEIAAEQNFNDNIDIKDTVKTIKQEPNEEATEIHFGDKIPDQTKSVIAEHFDIKIEHCCDDTVDIEDTITPIKQEPNEIVKDTREINFEDDKIEDQTNSATIEGSDIKIEHHCDNTVDIEHIIIKQEPNQDVSSNGNMIEMQFEDEVEDQTKTGTVGNLCIKIDYDCDGTIKQELNEDISSYSNMEDIRTTIKRDLEQMGGEDIDPATLKRKHIKIEYDFDENIDTEHTIATLDIEETEDEVINEHTMQMKMQAQCDAHNVSIIKP